MKRLAGITNFLLLTFLIAGAAKSATAYQPTECVGPQAMRDELARYQNACLTDAAGNHDNRYNHVMTDFLTSGRKHAIDSRLPAAIADVESLYRTRRMGPGAPPLITCGTLLNAHTEVCR